ncbi:MAG TPA: MJ0042-type zinc finger domain-containing protein [Sphingomicrobium sp.]
MILTCPNCETQYAVKDGAIPPQGRQVRCASCGHSWHQAPEPAAELELGPEAEAADAEPSDEGFAEAAVIEPASGPEAEERAYETAALAEAAAEEPQAVDDAEDADDERWRQSASAEPADYDAPPGPEIQPDDDFSPFAERDQAEPRRRSPLLAILILLVIVAALAAGVWFLAPPEWKARLGLAEASTPLQLSNPPLIERRPLASGQDLLTVSGRVINPTDKTQTVPPIYAELRDAAGKVIYKWTIAPPAATIGPGGTASFNSTEVNVPSQSEDLTITLGQPKA